MTAHAMPRDKPEQAILEQVYIFGYDHNSAFKGRERLISHIPSHSGVLMLGDTADGVTLEKVRESLDGRIDETTRLFILMHGGLKDGHHTVTLSKNETIPIKEVFITLSASSKDKPLFITVGSCYGGAANLDVQDLPIYSVVILLTEPDEVGTSSSFMHISQGIEQYIKKKTCGTDMERELPSPHQMFMDWMPYVAAPATSFCVSQGPEEEPKTFTYRPFDGRPVRNTHAYITHASFQQGNFTGWYKEYIDPKATFLAPKKEITEQEMENVEDENFLLLVIGRKGKYFSASINQGLGKKKFVKEQLDRKLSLWGYVGNKKALEVFMEVCTDFNAKDKNGNTPLHFAVINKHFTASEWLIKAGARANEKNKDGNTPLHFEASVGIEIDKIRKLLTDNGADPKATNKNGETPLHVAAKEGKLHASTFLINIGAELEAKNKNGETPLHVAAKEGALDLKILLQGGNLKAKKKGLLDVVTLLLKEGVNLETTNKDRETPLHVAVKEGFLDMVTLLVEKGADLEAKRGVWEETPLHVATEKGNLDAATFLINNGADLEAKGGVWKETPLSLAVREGKLDMVTLLVGKGADPKAKNKNEETPLHVAAEKGNLDAATFLINIGADLEAIGDIWNETPLSSAVREGKLDMVTLLLEKGASLEAKGGIWEETPLSLAAREGKLDMVTLLLEKGADVNGKNEDGKTPLHVAVEKGLLGMVTLLLEKGAALEAKGDIWEETPLSLAVREGKLDMVTLLVGKGADIKEEILSLAVEIGNLDVIEFLKGKEEQQLITEDKTNDELPDIPSDSSPFYQEEQEKQTLHGESYHQKDFDLPLAA